MAFLKPIHKSTATPRTLKYSFLSLGILGGAPAITYYFFGPEKEIEKFTIADQITKGKRTILSQNSDNWGIKLYVYTSSPELQHKFQDKVKSVKNLKNWCAEILIKEANDNDYLVAEKLCTTPTNKEKFERFQWKIIDHGDESRWKIKANSYNQSEYKNTGIIKAGIVNSKDIKQWCEATAEKEIKDGDEIYKLTKRFCTRKNVLS